MVPHYKQRHNPKLCSLVNFPKVTCILNVTNILKVILLDNEIISSEKRTCSRFFCVHVEYFFCTKHTFFLYFCCCENLLLLMTVNVKKSLICIRNHVHLPYFMGWFQFIITVKNIIYSYKY